MKHSDQVRPSSVACTVLQNRRNRRERLEITACPVHGGGGHIGRPRLHVKHMPARKGLPAAPRRFLGTGQFGKTSWPTSYDSCRMKLPTLTSSSTQGWAARSLEAERSRSCDVVLSLQP